MHGGEFRFEPESEIKVANSTFPAPLAKAVERLARSVPGVQVEDKGIAIVVHYRAAPAMQAHLETELRDLIDAHSNRLVLSHGRKVIELMPRTVTKGAALGQLMEHGPFRGRQPVMIGDDAPDETALATATRLGGVGLKVMGEYFEKDAADFRNPADVRQWLCDLAERLET